MFIEKNIIENIDKKLSYDIESISLVWQSEKKLALRSSKDNYYMIVPNSYSYVGKIAKGAIFPDNLISLEEGYHNIELIGESGRKFSSRALISKINNDAFFVRVSFIIILLTEVLRKPLSIKKFLMLLVLLIIRF